MDAEELQSELEEVTKQRDLLREMVAIMQPNMTVQGRVEFEAWKDARARKLAEELRVAMETR